MTKQANLGIGNKVPLFNLYDQDGKNFSVESLIGKTNFVVYFYPKDETTVCTAQACSFRDSYSEFKDLNCEVIGISSDDQKSHESFAKNHQLPFILLSDENQEVRKKFGVPKDLLFIPGRYTYVINKKGIVVSVFNSALNAKKHIDSALEILKKEQ